MFNRVMHEDLVLLKATIIHQNDQVLENNGRYYGSKGGSGMFRLFQKVFKDYIAGNELDKINYLCRIVEVIPPYCLIFNTRNTQYIRFPVFQRVSHENGTTTNVSCPNDTTLSLKSRKIPCLISSVYTLRIQRNAFWFLYT